MQLTPLKLDDFLVLKQIIYATFASIQVIFIQP